MPDIDKLKAQQEKVKTEIRQLENRQKTVSYTHLTLPTIVGV